MQSLELLGIPDQNLPVFKEARVQRLNSIDKISSLINVSKRLAPKLPKELFALKETDPEWDDKMVYPTINHFAYVKKLSFFGLSTVFFAYNWNRIVGNARLKIFRVLYPISSMAILGDVFYNYNR